ncbi:Rhodanese domain protein [Planctopirus limnophila DSM 3776]|uniref:Rhodanese domain protein n=1 Tax=Planctopirus limnophila (strain ATCC 43296 / DSM 3776 / IFAM 1008 / Mu 290) TaxID=521674 RepID=D5SU34_PLAL2|nr:rhodanese-like domain-containing protein [Planctopirus limnophila]ADG67019.1 Rhodanese domain protein [Planctopirus limnophila DSM 3776]
MTIPTILPIELKTRLDAAEPVTIIDVRTPLEFQEVHAEGAVNIPLDELEAEKLSRFVNPESKTVYLICRSGGRGKKACEKLLATGPWQPINIEGGTQAWEAAGLPVHRGKKVMSLERQVRIAAGSLVVLGCALGAFVTPYAFGLAAFVGAGLVFAGVTDTCAMGLLIARMPWNSTPRSTPSCSLNPTSPPVTSH